MKTVFRFKNAVAYLCAVAVNLMTFGATPAAHAANLHIASVTIVGNTLVVSGSGFDSGDFLAANVRWRVIS